MIGSEKENSLFSGGFKISIQRIFYRNKKWFLVLMILCVIYFGLMSLSVSTSPTVPPERNHSFNRSNFI